MVLTYLGRWLTHLLIFALEDARNVKKHPSITLFPVVVQLVKNLNVIYFIYIWECKLYLRCNVYLLLAL